MDDETWTTAEVARLSGVTSRTLRHYDEVGLLRPVGTGNGGVRLYGRAELLRLQQVLVLRELGLPLPEIAAALDGDGGAGGVTTRLLRDHRARLLAEASRLRVLAATVGRTIDDVEGSNEMGPAELFDGFDPRTQTRYEEDLVERYGDAVLPHIEESRDRVGRMTRQDAAAVQRAFADVDQRIAALMDEGASPDDPAVQDVIVLHHATVSRFWTPGADAYAGLGDLYVDHPDFRARYDAVRPGLAEFLRDAMAVHALEHLT